MVSITFFPSFISVPSKMRLHSVLIDPNPLLGFSLLTIKEIWSMFWNTKLQWLQLKAQICSSTLPNLWFYPGWLWRFFFLLPFICGSFIKYLKTSCDLSLSVSFSRINIPSSFNFFFPQHFSDLLSFFWPCLDSSFFKCFYPRRDTRAPVKSLSGIICFFSFDQNKSLVPVYCLSYLQPNIVSSQM